MKKLPLLLLISLFSLTQSALAQSTQELMPLKVGNSWIYSEILYRDDLTINQQRTDTVIVVKDTVINDITWYSVYTRSNRNYTYMRNSEKGLHWMQAREFTPVADEFVAFPYPATEGNESQFATVKLKLRNLSKELLWQGKTIKCVEYVIPEGPGVETVFNILPGVGNVLIERYANDLLNIRYELTQFIPAE